jgi:nucleolar protein 15|uniref:RRM domain-containing protein n=1 Tax=Picea sitchensis TaxID=3332 RepID=A9NT23_PICSI|nr:unknown [Picea sitchensis]
MGNRAKKKTKEAAGVDDFLPLEGNNVNQVQSVPIKKQAQEKDPIFSAKKKPTVLYIGHIPHGFFEDQMRGFFSQFGAIKRLRISRNRKTGKSKHYGFIEFESPAVAEIVADCMHNYLLFEHILKVQLVPPEKIHPQLWNGSNRKFKPLKWQRIQMKHHNRERTAKEQDHLMKAILKKDAKRRKKIEAAGIEYDYPDITDGLPPVPKKIKFSDDQE